MIFYDTETCGLCGPAVLIQYAKGIQGETILHSVWTNPIQDTLDLIEEMMSDPEGVCGFNMVFDHFQLCKLYTMFSLWPHKDDIPEDIIEELALLEPRARDGKALKPVTALDLMLFARKGPYQSTMDRHDIRIKRVPTQIAWQLAQELDKRIPLKDIYFAKKKNKTRWEVCDIEDADGDIVPDFKDIVLKFAASSALKALAADALNLNLDRDILLFSDIEISHNLYPTEFGYAPFALAVGGPGKWNWAWPEVIKSHINHWTYNALARQYATNDVKYLQLLYEKFGRPDFGDDDSILSCCVAACRWRGYKVNIEGIKRLKEEVIKSKTITLPNGKEFQIPTYHTTARYYVTEVMNDDEKMIVEDSTKKVILQEISKWETEDPKDSNKLIRHAAAIRAEHVLKARDANYQIDFFDKLLLAGRLHADFKIIGALSSRMSGDSGLNAQGIKKQKEIRCQFPLCWEDEWLSGGDFSAFEITLAIALYNDAGLQKELLTCELCEGKLEWHKDPVKVSNIILDLNKYISWRLKAEKKAVSKDKTYIAKSEDEIASEYVENEFICKNCGSSKGKKIHALFGINFFPEHTYESLKASEGTDDDKYTKSKSGVFSVLYGGTIHTLIERLGVTQENAERGLALFHKKYPGVRIAQQRVTDSFCSMRQPKGIGTKVEWHEPKEYVESMFGFRRYFTLENQICKALFELANKPPKEWQDLMGKVKRRDRYQLVSGAAQSALFAAAFALQASNTRAAANHEIQSSGAQITKRVQRVIWELQPPGANDWLVQPMNIHDEIMVPLKPEVVDKVKDLVVQTVESFRLRVPLIKIDWVKRLNSWAEKG